MSKKLIARDNDMKTVVELYQSLPLDQCEQLYHMQKDNFGYHTKKAVLAIIGAKFIYKENYRPGANRKDRQNQNNQAETANG